MSIREKRLALGVLIALVAGCAAPVLVYERLDALAGWRLNDYVTLEPEQKLQFRRDFGELWRWHRQHELPAYASDLREIANRLDSSVGAEQVAAYSERFRGHWRRGMARTVAALCPVAQSLDDAQAREILAEVDAGIEQYVKEAMAPPTSELRQKNEKQMGKWIKRWNGPLNPRQVALLKQWAGQRQDVAAEWLDYRQEWRARLEQALHGRRSSARCEPFEVLFVTPADLRREKLVATMAHNDRLWQDFIADIIAAAEPRQREHAQRGLREFADQLVLLAEAPQPIR